LTQLALHREHDFDPVLDLQLDHEIGHVVLDRLLAQVEIRSDLPVRLAVEKILDDLLLAVA